MPDCLYCGKQVHGKPQLGYHIRGKHPDQPMPEYLQRYAASMAPLIGGGPAPAPNPGQSHNSGPSTTVVVLDDGGEESDNPDPELEFDPGTIDQIADALTRGLRQAFREDMERAEARMQTREKRREAWASWTLKHGHVPEGRRSDSEILRAQPAGTVHTAAADVAHDLTVGEMLDVVNLPQLTAAIEMGLASYEPTPAALKFQPLRDVARVHPRNPHVGEAMDADARAAPPQEENGRELDLSHAVLVDGRTALQRHGWLLALGGLLGAAGLGGWFFGKWERGELGRGTPGPQEA